MSREIEEIEELKAKLKKAEAENKSLKTEVSSQYPKYDAEKNQTYLSATEWRYGDVRSFYPFGC